MVNSSQSPIIIKDPEPVDLATPSGPMRTSIFRPAAPGRYPGLLLYSEIFQVTGPIRRTAALLAYLQTHEACTGRLGALASVSAGTSPSAPR